MIGGVTFANRREIDIEIGQIFLQELFTGAIDYREMLQPGTRFRRVDLRLRWRVDRLLIRAKAP